MSNASTVYPNTNETATFCFVLHLRKRRISRREQLESRAEVVTHLNPSYGNTHSSQFNPPNLALFLHVHLYGDAHSRVSVHSLAPQSTQPHGLHCLSG